MKTAIENQLQEKIRKLLLIKTNTGFSQERIAREIGVSTQTSHNWLNGKSSPKSQVQIAGIDGFIGRFSEYLKK